MKRLVLGGQWKNKRLKAWQVWAADITYIPMAKGFLYLVAIMDWYTRYVVAWRLCTGTAGGIPRRPPRRIGRPINGKSDPFGRCAVPPAPSSG